jgi:hypothetical protein
MMEFSMPSKQILLVLAFSASAVSIAWSADETTPSATPAAQQSAAAASSDSAVKAPAKTTTAAAAAAAAAKDSDEDEKRLLARGYKKETRGNGQVVYCRKELKTGSHFETKQCGTAESMALAEQQARDLMHNSQYSAGSKTN